MNAASSTRAERLRKRSAERREQQKVDTRRAILDAATALFLKQGFEKFSLRQVAEAIGYSATTIYLYFEDKDDLLYHVAIEGFKRFGEMLQTAYASSEEPLGRLKAIGQAYVQFGLENPVHYRLMFMQRGEFLQREPPEGYESVIDSFGILTQTIRECLAAGLIKEGEVMTYAAMVWSTVHGIVSLSISTPYFERAAVPVILERSQDMIVNGIRR
jgi:AcrR family transcriptional regulator